MAKHLIEKHNLNLAGEYRVAAELLLRGLHASVTYGNRKGVDLYVIGKNRRAAVIEVKASQGKRFVTGLYQKYRTADAEAPDFWVLYAVAPTEGTIAERFFVLSHQELALIQGETNCPGESLTHEEIAVRVKIGVDNVSLKSVESHEGAWGKVLDYCNTPLPGHSTIAGS